MYIVLLRFSDNKPQAAQYMQGHNDWIAKGFAEGVFLVSGSLQPNQGGAVIAHGITREDLEERLTRDPFVAENVVTAEILEITPAKASEQMQFLLTPEQQT